MGLVGVRSIGAGRKGQMQLPLVAAQHWHDRTVSSCSAAEVS
jgi:hypothetical protein